MVLLNQCVVLNVCVFFLNNCVVLICKNLFVATMTWLFLGTVFLCFSTADFSWLIVVLFPHRLDGCAHMQEHSYACIQNPRYQPNTETHTYMYGRTHMYIPADLNSPLLIDRDLDLNETSAIMHNSTMLKTCMR